MIRCTHEVFMQNVKFTENSQILDPGSFGRRFNTVAPCMDQISKYSVLISYCFALHPYEKHELILSGTTKPLITLTYNVHYFNVKMLHNTNNCYQGTKGNKFCTLVYECTPVYANSIFCKLLLHILVLKRSCRNLTLHYACVTTLHVHHGCNNNYYIV